MKKGGVMERMESLIDLIAQFISIVIIAVLLSMFGQPLMEDFRQEHVVPFEEGVENGIEREIFELKEVSKFNEETDDVDTIFISMRGSEQEEYPKANEWLKKFTVTLEDGATLSIRAVKRTDDKVEAPYMTAYKIGEHLYNPILYVPSEAGNTPK